MCIWFVKVNSRWHFLSPEQEVSAGHPVNGHQAVD